MMPIDGIIQMLILNQMVALCHTCKHLVNEGHLKTYDPPAITVNIYQLIGRIISLLLLMLVVTFLQS